MQVQFIQLNIPQQIFTLFYAITWGTAANSQPRWKAFAWAAIRDDAASRRRAWLSVFLLNVLPLVYFVSVLGCLSSESLWNTTAWWKIFFSILPAFAPFGLYRIWLAAVQQWSERFYGPLPAKDREPCEQDNRPEMWKQIGIELKVASDLNQRWALGNFFWGTVYILFGPVVIFIVWCLSRHS
jgi:hypothetical protein